MRRKPERLSACLSAKPARQPVESGIHRDSPGDSCADDKRNVRAFEYHVPEAPLIGPFLKVFGRPNMLAMTVVCLDADAKVTSTHLHIY